MLEVLLTHRQEAAAVAPVGDFDVRDPVIGETVLHYVLKMPQRSAGLGREEGYRRALGLLLDSPLLEREVGRSVNRQDLEGNTALHYASQAWGQDIVR